MANTLSRLAGPVAVASGTSTVLTVTTAHTFTIKKIRVVNTDLVNAKDIQLFVNGSAAGNAVMNKITVDPNSMIDDDPVLTLASTDTLQAITSATGLTITVSGLDQS